MSRRASAMIWLVFALIFGFITLTILCGGGYYLWHTDSIVKRIDKQLEDDKAEQKQLQTRALKEDELKRFQELNKRLNEPEEYNAASKDRAYALGGVVTFVIPALMTVAFFIMFIVKWLKARAADKRAAEEEDDEEEEEEAEEEPPAKETPKRKPKPAAEDDN